MLKAQNINFRAGTRQILKQVSFTVKAHQLTVCVGPNGAGKSSLLKLLANEYQAESGTLELNRRDISRFSASELAVSRAVLSQNSELNFNLKVLDVVLLGRLPHKTSNAHNLKIVEEVMALSQSLHLIDRIYTTLSGGEKQKVQLARVLAQIWEDRDEPNYLFLDEPNTALDMAMQHSILSLVKKLCKQKNIAVFAIIHDLNLAAQYADKMLFLKEGQLIASGSVEETMCKGVVEATFAQPVIVIKHPTLNCPLIVADCACES